MPAGQRYLNALRKPGTNKVVDRRASQRTAGISGSEMLRLVLKGECDRERKARFQRASTLLRRTRQSVNAQVARETRNKEKIRAQKHIEDYERIRKERSMLESKKANDDSMLRT